MRTDNRVRPHVRFSRRRTRLSALHSLLLRHLLVTEEGAAALEHAQELLSVAFEVFAAQGAGESDHVVPRGASLVLRVAQEQAELDALLGSAWHPSLETRASLGWRPSMATSPPSLCIASGSVSLCCFKVEPSADNPGGSRIRPSASLW